MKKRNNNFGKNKSKFDEPRINDEIRGYETLRLVYKENSYEKSDNDFSMLVSIDEAREISKEKGLDLVEINTETITPIVWLCDYSKYLFERKKKLKDRTKNTTTLKEIQLSVNISEHDLEIKANKAKDFIKNGDKVKVVLTMKGRENTRRDYSKECFNRFIEIMSDVAIPENQPKDEGNKAIVILKSKKK